MIFVVDSGSTKTDWIALGSAGEVLFSTQTLGLNPQVLSSAILNERIINNFDLYQNKDKVSHIYFYGAVEIGSRNFRRYCSFNSFLNDFTLIGSPRQKNNSFC